LETRRKKADDSYRTQICPDIYLDTKIRGWNSGIQEEWVNLYYTTSHLNLKDNLLITPSTIPIFQHSSIPASNLQPQAKRSSSLQYIGCPLHLLLPHALPNPQSAIGNLLTLYLLQ
jgi:hypothetical protein